MFQKKDANKLLEYLTSFAFMGIGLFVFLEGRNFRGNDKYFPMIVGVLTFLVAIWIFLEDSKQENSCFDIKKVNFLAVGVTCAALFIYVFLFKEIGFILSTSLLGITILVGMRFQNKLGTVLYPVIMVAVIFVVFKVLLKVPLPTVIFYK